MALLLETAMLLVMAAALLALALWVLVDIRVRFAALLFGALIVFQSSDEITRPKIFYVLLLGAVTIQAVSHHLNRLSKISLTVGLLLSVLAFIAIERGNNPVGVGRDSLNMFMVCAAAPLADYFGKRLSPRTIGRFAFVLAGVGSYSFFAAWSTKRGLAELPPLGLPSFSILAFAASAAAALATLTRRHGLWWIVCAAVIIEGLLTGTRGLVLIVMSPLCIVWWTTRQRHDAQVRKTARVARTVAVLVVPVATVLALSGASSAGVDVGAAFQRLSTVTAITKSTADSGTANTRIATAASQSLVERKRQQAVAWETFSHSPIIGVGPGRPFVYQDYAGQVVSVVSIDTSLSLLSKWGVLGAFATLYLMWSWWQFLRPRRGQVNLWSLTALGLMPVMIVASLLAPILEDRGFPLVLVLLGAGMTASRKAISRPVAPKNVAQLRSDIQSEARVDDSNLNGAPRRVGAPSISSVREANTVKNYRA